MKVDLKKYWILISTSTLILGAGMGIGIGYKVFSESAKSSYDVGSTLVEAIRVTPQISSNQQILNKSSDFITGLVTDGNGEINDKSFYEESGKGLIDIYGLTNELNDRTNVSLYREPSSGSANTIIQNYVTLYNTFESNATRKVIIAPGYGHQEAIYKFWQQRDNTTTYNDLYFLLIDNEPYYENTDPNSNSTSEGLHNTFGITFDVSASGFKAGYLSALYLEATNDKDPKVGLWGGEKIPPILSFLRGFVSGIKYYNENNNTKEDVKFVKFLNKEEYTNSGYNTGGGRGKADFLVANGADVILPVAGGQTTDLIDSIKSSNRKEIVKIVGVDTDPTVPFSKDKDLFITSIIKELRKAVYEGFKELRATSTETGFEYSPKTGESWDSFEGNLNNNFVSYLKMFSEKTQDIDVNHNNQIWKWIYGKVDSASALPQNIFSTWTPGNDITQSALEYIKNN